MYSTQKVPHTQIDPCHAPSEILRLSAALTVVSDRVFRDLAKLSVLPRSLHLLMLMTISVKSCDIRNRGHDHGRGQSIPAHYPGTFLQSCVVYQKMKGELERETEREFAES